MKINKIKLITTILLFGILNIANANYRDMSYEGINLNESWENTPNYNQNDSMVVKNALTDKNKKLNAVVGKSQVLNFDIPVKRISIADPNIADIIILTPTQLMINGKTTGNTTVIFWSTDTNPVFYNLVVQQDVDEFLKAVDYIAPNEDVTIIFNEKGAVLSGQVSTTATKKKILDLAKAYNIELTDVSESSAKQVLLEVKIAEVSKSFTRSLGTNFSLGDLSVTPSFPTGLGTAQALVENGIKYFFSNASGNFIVALQAAETKGDAQILAEPKLLAADGEDASFNVGNEVPVPSSVGQYGQIAYDFKQTGVILNFTPTIMEKSNRIKLKLSPEVSEIDRANGVVDANNAVVVPGFKTRKVDTTVELMDGETLVIAGLLNNTSSKTNNQVPFLGDIPILGFLFKQVEDTKDDTELIIFITPKIVNTPQSENL